MNDEVKFYTCSVADEKWSTNLRTYKCECPSCHGLTIIAEKIGMGFQLVNKCQHYVGASAAMPPHVVVCFRLEQVKKEWKGFSVRF